MKLSVDQCLHGFTVRTCEPLPEIDGTAYTLVHNRSKARLLYLQNEDSNKAFSIGFKTPPADDTGVFHILEHSVLCGSDKFPVKEPFVNLLKTSMQTFLNAMTFSDKTMYPVASTNEQDLLNLMDVYLDAVLHPLIYHQREILEQEGWHYELAEVDGGAGEARAGGIADDTEANGSADETADNSETSIDEAPTEAPSPSATPELRLNGVVYNEMKGVMSDPNSVLYDQLQAALFPDTAYRFESGGMPQSIPDLTQEQFLEEHASHYRLDNSYLTLYGDLDLDRMLAFLDENYLTPVAAEQEALAAQRASEGKAPLAPHDLNEQQSVTNLGIVHSMATAPENACMGLGYVIGNAHERTRMVAVDILMDAILGSNEAPLKRALLDAGLADDVQGFIAEAMLQPFAVIQLKGLAPDAAAKFRPLVEQTLRSLSDGALDHDLIEASLSRAEFIMREHDFGISDGVALAMTALSGWLYDDELATAYLRYENDFMFLRNVIEDGYFERLITDVFLNNNHRAEVEIKPVEMSENTFEAKRLADAAANMGPEDFERIAEEVATLRQHQTEPDKPEDLATLPYLSVADIGEAPNEPTYGPEESAPVPCIHHQVPTRGIIYASQFYDLNCLTFKDLPFVTILALVLGKLDTAHHTASELDTLINGQLGNLSFYSEVFEGTQGPRDLIPRFVVEASALADNVAQLAELPREIVLETDFSDTSKIKDVLQQHRLGMEQSFAAAGHTSAMARCSSYYLPAGVAREQLGGVDFYRFLKKLLAKFDDYAEKISQKLNSIAKCLFVDDGLTISLAGPDEELERYWQAGPTTGRSANQNTQDESQSNENESQQSKDESQTQDKAQNALRIPDPLPHNEAFVIPSDVNYAAQGFDHRNIDGIYTGAWQVAARALSYNHLWNEVRVKGGAYGAGLQVMRTGNVRLYSYRDPHLDETLARFGQSVEWLAQFHPTPEEMEGYIVSTVAGFDVPLKPRMLIRRQDSAWFGGRTPEGRLRSRSEMLSATDEQLRRMAVPIGQGLDKGAICVFGNRDVIEASHAGLVVIDLLNE